MNTIKVFCENPDELIAGFGAGARIRIQTSTTEAGAFSDVTTIALAPATNSYTYEHLAGISSTWYKFRFEDSTGANANDYGAAFQVGDETTGLLCSLYDVCQRMFGTSTTSVNNTEQLAEIIKGVSVDIEGYVGRWLAPRPTNPASTTTLLFDVECYGTSLLLEQGHRVCGIRTLSSIGVASASQPESGGTYTTATLADVLLRPRPNADGPASRLELTNFPTGPVSRFFAGFNVVTVTGSFGFASVPADIQEVAIAAVTKRFIGKETAAPIVALGPDGGVTILSDLSPGNRATLNRYRWPLVQ